MPLFRRNRSTTQESLFTTVVIKDINDLREIIIDDWKSDDSTYNKNYNLKDFIIKTEVVCPLKKGLDPTTGWYTHYVYADILKKDKFLLVGYLSEPLEIV